MSLPVVCGTDGWTQYTSTDAFEDRNAKVMSAKDIDKVKHICKYEGFGGFIVWKGNAHCRRMQPKDLEKHKVPMRGATLYIAPSPDSSGHTFGDYSERRELTVTDDVFYHSTADAFTEQLTASKIASPLASKEFKMVFPPEHLLIETNGHRLVKSLCPNALLSATVRAHREHLALEISPDVVWLQIMKGVCRHVEQNPASEVVDENGVPDFFFEHEGIPPNTWYPWDAAFSHFSSRIREHIGKRACTRTVQYFNTSTESSRFASQMALMSQRDVHFPSTPLEVSAGSNDSDSSDGSGSTGMIPSFTVTGTPHDWRDIQRRVRLMTEVDFSLSWWTDALLPVLSEIEKSCATAPTDDFWKSWFTQRDCGCVGGHIMTLFPYVYLNGKFEENISITLPKRKSGYREQDFVSCISTVNVALELSDDSYQRFRLTSGVLGTTYNSDDNILQPVIGWAASEKPPKVTNKRTTRRR